MTKQEDKIISLVILIFVIFAIFYLIFTLTPLIYLVITIVVIIIILTVSSYLLYKNNKQILPFVIIKYILDFIRKTSFSKPSAKKGGRVSPPLPQYEKDRIIVELAKGKCEYPNCSK